jgi:hypothetical protein
MNVQCRSKQTSEFNIGNSIFNIVQQMPRFSYIHAKKKEHLEVFVTVALLFYSFLRH